MGGTPGFSTAHKKNNRTRIEKTNKNGDLCAESRKQIFALPPNERKK